MMEKKGQSRTGMQVMSMFKAREGPSKPRNYLLASPGCALACSADRGALAVADILVAEDTALVPRPDFE